MPSTGMLADKLKKHLRRDPAPFEERGNTAMKLFPYFCHFQIISVGTTAIFNLPFTAIKVQVGHQVLIKLRMHKVCYENPGSKTD